MTPETFKRKNDRRIALIDKKFHGKKKLTAAEKRELSALQFEVEAHLSVVAPRPSLLLDPEWIAAFDKLKKAEKALKKALAKR